MPSILLSSCWDNTSDKLWPRAKARVLKVKNLIISAGRNVGSGILLLFGLSSVVRIAMEHLLKKLIENHLLDNFRISNEYTLFECVKTICTSPYSGPKLDFFMFSQNILWSFCTIWLSYFAFGPAQGCRSIFPHFLISICLGRLYCCISCHM